MVSFAKINELEAQYKPELTKISINDGSNPKPEGTIRFVCISDTHCKAKASMIPDGDVLLHAGDFTSIGRVSEIEQFIEFIDELPHTHKVVIAGNHDLSFDEENFAELKDRFYFDTTRGQVPVLKKQLGHVCTYLEDSATVVEGYHIYGSPWSPRFCDWGFNADRGEQSAAIWSRIPDECEILITHGPPFFIGDFTADGIHVGCEELLKSIVTRVNPLLHVFGHIHEGYGAWKSERTTFVNASTCGYTYKPTQKPVCIDLPRKSEEGAE